LRGPLFSFSCACSGSCSERVTDVCSNPKDDPTRLATALWFPLTVEPSLRSFMQGMCDRPAYGVPVEIARVFRPLYLDYDEEDVSIADDWNAAPTGLKRVPVGCVYCTTLVLLTWADVPVVRGETVHRARIELHEHVKRMDAYLKHRMETQ